jgi:Mg/Co/Ni transporter MgtE
VRQHPYDPLGDLHLLVEHLVELLAADREDLRFLLRVGRRAAGHLVEHRHLPERLARAEDGGRLADLVAAFTAVPFSDKQRLLEIIDPEQRLLGVVSFRELFSAQPEKTVRDIMRAMRKADEDDIRYLIDYLQDSMKKERTSL